MNNFSKLWKGFMKFFSSSAFTEAWKKININNYMLHKQSIQSQNNSSTWKETETQLNKYICQITIPASKNRSLKKINVEEANVQRAGIATSLGQVKHRFYTQYLRFYQQLNFPV